MSGEYSKLVDEIRNCKKCRLWQYRKNPVPGEGPLDSKIMFIGEAPGKSEDERGRPFVGAAGKLLTELIEMLGLKRSDVYITNIVKCRPPGNRDPQPDEVEACLPYLLKQISLLRPRVIIALGRHSANLLFKLVGKEWFSMARQHGSVIEGKINNIKVFIIPTYHPAAALYNPGLRDKLENDFRGPIKKLVEENIFGKREKRETSSRKSQRKLTDYFSF